MRKQGKNALQAIFCDALDRNDHADFKIIFWDGRVHKVGKGDDFTVYFKTKSALKKVLLDLPLGFGEGYMNGDIEIEGDLSQVVNVGLLSDRLQDKKPTSLLNSVALNLLQRNNKKADKRNIAYHYDLGNDFYKLWLDSKMLYSCAYFKDDRDSLEQAQIQKINLCCRKLQLQPDEHLLDIGCGWGGLLINAAKQYGIRGVGITLSKDQLAYGRDQLKKEGLQGRVQLKYMDYRDLPLLNQTFDKVVSVGMFEHVGKANMNRFLKNARKVLRPDGLLLLHTIGKTLEEPTNSWIRKYIFPGCHLPDIGSILTNTTQHGLSFIDCENMRIHYSKTLDSWGLRFEENETRIRLMFDDRFIRMWRLYLAGCSALFRLGKLHVFQFLFSAGVRNDLPLTREWMLEDSSP
ncbi:cyclopropane-fatty-acyl-phospholipid synthase family protein [Desulfopila sp. IMCC35008]|uniref:SAM-dependent methyltransferase n=1 Tax=Desulfopila sp. IMCC35008 TaxID=2653858 RepID=UPI0013D6C301|nr:cyclopropane-fatty-acyl-phospholipid synthase family protein [Desulfopila sp. IMCC35008]